MGKHKTTPMTKEAAQRIQAAADKAGTSPGFKARAMLAAAKNAESAEK